MFENYQRMLNKFLVSAFSPLSIWQVLATVKEVVAHNAHNEQNLLCSLLVFIDSLILESEHAFFPNLYAWQMSQEIINCGGEFLVSDLPKGFINFVRKPVP